MKEDVMVLLIVIVVLIAAWNGLVITWEQEKNEKNKADLKAWWHKIGFVIRACLALIAFIHIGWVEALIVSFVCWIPYNIIISKIAWNKWFVLGNKGIDGVIKRLLG